MIPRLYVQDALHEQQLLSLSREHAHYLGSVLRRKQGEVVLLFNGQDGEWRAEIVAVAKKQVEVRLLAQTRAQQEAPDIALYFAPIKLGRIDYLVEKAAELGVRYLQPVVTERTQVSRIKQERLQAHAVEAAEQCERLTVPEVTELVPLANVLKNWDEARTLILCDETGAGKPLLELASELEQPCAVLVGPEGGFSDAELEALRAVPQLVSASLGPRVLRADTAALAAVTILQSTLGDWQSARPSVNAR